MTVRASGGFQNNGDKALAQQMLAKMSPEERVGQLFLVAFTGSSVNEQSQIYDLVTRYHIGGVVLRAENDNFLRHGITGCNRPGFARHRPTREC